MKERRPQAPFGPSVDSLCHPWFTTTNLSYRFPIFETSATALCGTTGTLMCRSIDVFHLHKAFHPKSLHALEWRPPVSIRHDSLTILLPVGQGHGLRLSYGWSMLAIPRFGCCCLNLVLASWTCNMQARQLNQLTIHKKWQKCVRLFRFVLIKLEMARTQLPSG